MDNKMIHFESSIGNDMLDLVERHGFTGARQTALMVGRREEDACYIDSFLPNTKDAGIYLVGKDNIGVLLYSFFQEEEIELAKSEFLDMGKQIPSNVLFGLVNFEKFLLFQKTEDNILKPINNFMFESIEEQKIAS